jgi:hypothetical protein
MEGVDDDCEGTAVVEVEVAGGGDVADVVGVGDVDVVPDGWPRL